MDIVTFKSILASATLLPAELTSTLERLAEKLTPLSRSYIVDQIEEMIQKEGALWEDGIAKLRHMKAAMIAEDENH